VCSGNGTELFREWYGMIPGNGTELFPEWYGTIPGMVRNDSRAGAVWYMDEAGLMRQKGY